MSKWANSFISFLGTAFLYLLIGYSELVGVYHAFEKHNAGDGVLALFVPPWAWYRSAEIWWHNDFADLNWDERLKTDRTNCLIMLTEYGQENAIRINEEIENAKVKFAKYPKEKYHLIKTFCNEYIKYYELAQKEFSKWAFNYLYGGSEAIPKSSNLATMENNLSKYNLLELNNAMKQVDSLFIYLAPQFQNMRKSFQASTKEEQASFINSITENGQKRIELILTAYRNLFGEDFNEGTI